MDMEILEVFLALEVLLAGPALTNLLQKQIPLGFVPMAAGRFGAEVANRIIGSRPTLQMPGAGLAVRSANLIAVFLQ